jgi:hypothetical protein
MAAGSASASTIFFTDFDGSTPAEVTGAGGTVPIVFVQGDPLIDFLDVYQNNSTGNPAAATTLTLTGLAANQNLSLEFTFLAIGSWDGTTYQPGVYAPDYLNVTLNSTSIFQEAFRNYGTAGNPEYPGCSVGANCTAAQYPAPPAGTTIDLQQSAGDDFGSSIYNILVTGLTADSSGNAVFQFFASGNGWQGGGDESIGLDNIRVTSTDTAATPEPSTWALIGGALLCLPLIRRRAAAR